MLNYFGQLRLYSLLDLVVLLIAVNASLLEFTGVILLHIGFLALLELKHKHVYRKQLPKSIWVLLTVIGLVMFGHIEGLLFVLFGYLYTLKKQKYFGTFSPLMRGLQYFFVVAGIIGYQNNLIWVVLVLLTVRNFCGDLRDITRDRAENTRTLPVVLGISTDYKYIHLIFMLITTSVWLSYTDLSLFFLTLIFVVQILTYNLTPRNIRYKKTPQV